MPIFSRYVTRELLAIFLLATVTLFLVGVGGRFIGYLQEAAMGRFTGEALVTIMVLRLPEFLQLVLPFAFYLALVLTLSRLFADHELTALFAGGVSPGRVLGWVFVSAAVVAGIVAVLSLRVTPAMEAERARFMEEQRAARDFLGLAAGSFHSFSDGERVAYAEAMSDDRRRLEGVFLADRGGRDGDVTIWAEHGSQYIDDRTGSRFLLLERGRRYEGTPGLGDYSVVEFAAMGQRVEPPDPRLERLRVQARPSATLLAEGSLESITELHWRLALPIMTLLAAFFGFGIARARPREGRFAALVPALLAVLGYYLVIMVNQHLLLRGWLAPLLGLWPAHLLALALGAVLLRRLIRPAASG